jgi:hypothetical protein
MGRRFFFPLEGGGEKGGLSQWDVFFFFLLCLGGGQRPRYVFQEEGGGMQHKLMLNTD